MSLLSLDCNIDTVLSECATDAVLSKCATDAVLSECDTDAVLSECDTDPLLRVEHSAVTYSQHVDQLWPLVSA